MQWEHFFWGGGKGGKRIPGVKMCEMRAISLPFVIFGANLQMWSNFDTFAIIYGENFGEKYLEANALTLWRHHWAGGS